MKNSSVDEEGAWHLDSGCHSVITQKVITSNLCEPSDKTLPLEYEEMERDSL
jgi:hypothetical protein